MQKIIVIGCPGSGKSTFSKALHKIIGIPLFHLDMLFWNADKTTVEKAVFLEFIQNFQFESRPQILKLLEKFPHKNIHIFTNRAEADTFLTQTKIRQGGEPYEYYTDILRQFSI